MFSLANSMANNSKITVDYTTKSFVDANGEAFFPWGFNYITNAQGLLIEEIWNEEANWSIIEEDFREMKAYCANVVRIHLQYHEFMLDQTTPNQQALDNLKRLIELAEDIGLYLDITGLAAYRAEDQPAWYSELDDISRWVAHIYFWTSIANVGKNNDNIFCYNLINEPVVAVGCEPNCSCDWLLGELGEFNFIQNIARDPNREFASTMESWIRFQSHYIKLIDPDALITYGKLSLGAVDAFANEVDFISPHVYPISRKLNQSVNYVKNNGSNRPLVLEETYNLFCKTNELETFLDGIDGHYQGLMGHYFGSTIEDYKNSNEPFKQLRIDFLNFFMDNNPNNKDCSYCSNSVNKVYFPDNDGDYFGVAGEGETSCVRPNGYTKRAGDCDDNNKNVLPGSLEKCNGLDNNCNRQIDEDLSCSNGCNENINVYLKERQATSIELRWDSNGVDKYVFYLVDVQNSSTYLLQTSTINKVVFNDLKPETHYYVIAFTYCNSKLTPRSKITSVLTLSPPTIDTTPCTSTARLDKSELNTFNPYSNLFDTEINSKEEENKFFENFYNNIGISSLEFSDKNTIQVYPNPSKDHLYINISNASNSKEIHASVYDLVGKVQMQKLILDGNSELDISSLTNGTYFIHLNGFGFNESTKFVVNK